MAQFDDILTVEEAAEYLKLAKSTVYRLLQEHKLPGRKIGGAWRLSRRYLEEWIGLGNLDDEPITDGQGGELSDE